MLTITTPLHTPGIRYIEDTYDSLCAQSLKEWRWLIGENHGGYVPRELRKDPRVSVVTLNVEGVGALKRALSDQASTPYVVELDADDLLAPNALSSVADAFLGGADFVYSDFAEFHTEDWSPNRYSPVCGWESYPVTFQGHALTATRGAPVNAHSMRSVGFAPNHIRAWQKSFYNLVGGHDVSMFVGDDHDLMVRMYLAGANFCHIQDCLYFYRLHPQNTVNAHQQAIQDASERVYNRHCWQLAEKWADERNLSKIDLCGAHGCPDGYLPLDRPIDLEEPWPLDDSSVGILRAHDAVEHLKDPVHTMNEAYRVLAPGGFLMIHTPSTDGRGAFCDPTHKSFWNALSFRYYTDPKYAKYVAGFRGRFQVGRIVPKWYPTDWHERENVPYVEAHLYAVKPGYRAMGELLWGAS